MKKFTKRLLLCAVAASITATNPGISMLSGNQAIEVQAAQKKKKISKKQARKKVVKYIKKYGNWNTSYYLDYDHNGKNTYVFHYYEMMSDHTATVNWYDVNWNTGKVKPEF